MTTKAYIVGHKADSSTYTVRIPLFETAGSVPGKGTYLNSSLFEATLSYQPGNLNSYAVGDCVFVVFEDSRMAKPVIVGRLYSGSEGKATDAVNASSLSVADKAVLPGDTTVGGVTVSKLIQNCDSLNGLLTGKVDKVLGKGLSTNDYTTAEKSKLAGLAAVATTGAYSDLTGTPGAYMLPAATSSVLGGVKVGTGLTIDADGVLANANAAGTTYQFGDGTNGFTVTPSGGNAQTVSVTPSIAAASSSADGLMSSADKVKLDGVAAGAEANVNADWNATSGDAVILNKPTIPNVPVQSVNSKTGAVVLTGSDIATSSADSEKLDSKSVANMLHLGAYDSYTYDSTTGKYTVTRQTGYDEITGKNLVWRTDSGDYKYVCYASEWTASLGISPNATVTNDMVAPVLTNKYKTVSRNVWFRTGNEQSVCIQKDGNYFMIRDTSYSSFDSLVASINLLVQYKLATSYTETYDIRHFARTGQPYIEEWKKSEADRSSNLCDNATFLDDATIFSNCSANYSNGQLNIVSTGRDSYIGEWGVSTYNPKCGKRINVKPDTTYTLSTGSSDINKNYIAMYDSNGTTVSSIGNNDTNITTFTTPSTCAFITIRVGYESSVAGTTYPFNIMLSEGSAPLPYQPYEGEVVHGKGLAETLSAYPTSQSASKTYLSKADASSTYLSKANASSTYVAKSSLNTINGASMQTGQDLTITGSMTSGTVAIDSSVNSAFATLAFNHPNAIWSISITSGTPQSILIVNKYPVLVYVYSSINHSGLSGQDDGYYAHAYRFNPDTLSYEEITSGTLSYSYSS